MDKELLEQLADELPDRIEVPPKTPPAITLAERVFSARRGWAITGDALAFQLGEDNWLTLDSDTTKRLLWNALRRCVTWQRDVSGLGVVEARPWGTTAHVTAVWKTLRLSLPPV